MRIRVAQHLQSTVHRLALCRGLSDERAAELALAEGLRTFNGTAPPTAPVQESGADQRVRVAPRLYDEVKQVAARSGVSNAEAMRQVLTAGLRALAVRLPDINTRAENALDAPLGCN